MMTLLSYLPSCFFFHSQTGLTSAKTSGRSMAKEFVFDHSYWSVNPSDDHYADQEVVSHMTSSTWMYTF